MEELVKGLREDAEWAEANEWETPITLSDHLKQAADAIEELSKLRWIPVTERMPELHDEEYLDEVTGEMVHYKVSDPILIWLAKGGFMDIGMYERSDAVDDFCYQGVPHTVTYWASLPKPPEEGEA